MTKLNHKMKTTSSLRRALTVALPIASLGFFLSSQPLAADVLVQYNFGTVESPTLGTTFEAPGINGTALTATTGTAFDTDGEPVTSASNSSNSGTVQSNLTITNATGAAGALPVLGRPDGHTVSATAPTNVDSNPSYFSFTLTADPIEVPGATFSLESLQFDFGTGGGSARGFTVAFAVNGSTDFTLLGSDRGQSGGNFDETTFEHYMFTIPEVPAATDLTSAEFRFFTYASQVNGRNMFFDNITVNAIPEPSSLLLLGGGIAGLLLRRRRA